jgi:hypothetical protein
MLHHQDGWNEPERPRSNCWESFAPERVPARQGLGVNRIVDDQAMA